MPDLKTNDSFTVTFFTLKQINLLTKKCLYHIIYKELSVIYKTYLCFPLFQHSNNKEEKIFCIYRQSVLLFLFLKSLTFYKEDL